LRDWASGRTVPKRFSPEGNCSRSSQQPLDLGRARNFLQRVCQIVGLESKRARLALVGHAAVSIDQVDAVWPAGVGALGGVVESVDHCRELDPKFANTTSRHLAALVVIARAGENDLVLQIALRLPHVAGMRLDNVDNQERDLLVVLIVKLVERGNLPPKWWSSVAAENEHDRLRRGERRELHTGGLVELGQ